MLIEQHASFGFIIYPESPNLELLMNRFALSLLSLAVLAGSANAADWPQFRGPLQDGISPDTGLLKSWPEGGPKKLWTSDGAGMGYSSFTVSGGKLYTLGTTDGKVHLVCLDANSGDKLWSSPFADDDEKGYSAGWGGGPRSTPTVDGDKVYALGPKGVLACLAASDGDVLWSRNIQADFGGKAGGWGYSESPVIDGQKVLVAPGGGPGAIVALEKKSGETIWQSNIPGADKAEYATIVIAEIHGKRQYIKLFQQLLVGVSAEDGDVLWKSEWPRGRTAVIPTPIVDGNRVYITSGYGAGSKLVEIADDWETKDVWDNTEMKNHHGGVIKVGGYVYGFSDGPGLSCQSWETGELVWNQKERSINKGSIQIADGLIYCLNEGDGVCTIVGASPDGFVEKGSFKLDPQSEKRNPKGRVWTHPVVIGGKLYLRDQELISCYDVKG
ncbi:MAG: outer membrane protein assembly factor BamB [Verrucomicrobiales bacterium]